ncbi:PIGG (predicted) [Pycnogonum litorale]
MQFIAIIIFLSGFFPLKKTIYGSATFKDVDDNLFGEKLSNRNFSFHNQRPQYDRIVLIVIDALREDFVFGKLHKKNMKFTNDLLDNKDGLGFVAVVNPPTVTLPRIKSILTGNIPGFIDVVTNVNTAALGEDNWIDQSIRNNKNVIFFGDDTWIKLLPSQFTRHDGTTSFFVSDYTEVDNNVTRHLETELKLNSSWDVMILHYLGLDHIGHVAGPNSPLIPIKLREMDQVIERIYSKLRTKDADDGKKTVVIICGDHGMSDSGSHGGTSLSEVTTPLLIIPTSAAKRLKERDLNPKERPTVSQVDIVPTISAFLHQPIPINNLGKLILPALDTSDDNVLLWLFVNARQVIDVFELYTSGSFEEDDCFMYYDKAVNDHRDIVENGTNSRMTVDRVASMYSELVGCLKNKIMLKLINYDMYAIVTSLVLLSTGTFALVVSLSADEDRFKINPSILIFLTMFLFMHVLLCTGSCHQSILCTDYKYLAAVVVIISCHLHYLTSGVRLDALVTKVCRPRRSEYLYILGLVLHCLSLTSSSFVEEEHQIWYFFVTTACAIVLFRNIRSSTESYSKPLNSETVTWFVALIILRLIRSWNQTGDQWAHLPDIGNFLNEPENKSLLSILVLVSFVVVILMKLNEMSYSSIGLLAVGLYYVYTMRVATGTVLLFDDQNVSIDRNASIRSARLAYLSVGGLLCKTLYESRCIESVLERFGFIVSGIVTSWIVFSMLILRPHNIPSFTMLVILEYFVRRQSKSFGDATFLYLYLASASFFFQGNSSSLSTVDVSSGYIGLSGHNSAIVGTLIMNNTYSFYLFWLFSLVRLIVDSTSDPNRFLSQITRTLSLLSVHKCLVVLFYACVITSQRYHLFIWTVFAPKMLYETVSFFIILKFNFIIIILIFIIIHSKNKSRIYS